MTVSTFQILIFSSIFLTGILTNEKLLMAVTSFWAVWTLTHVFTAWLMFTQFSTIGLAWLVLLAIKR